MKCQRAVVITNFQQGLRGGSPLISPAGLPAVSKTQFLKPFFKKHQLILTILRH